MNAIQDGIADGRNRHAMMMRHDVAHHSVPLAFGQAGGGEIHRVVVSVRSECPQPVQLPKVGHRLRRLNLCGQQGGVGRHDIFVLEHPLERQVGRAEGVILVIHLAVAGVEGAFGHAPGPTQTTAILYLPRDRHAVRGIEDASGPFVHNKGWHEVFEHRARPGQQGRLRSDRGDRPSEPHPVFRWQIALGDGEKAGEACFGGQQVVAGFVQLLSGDAVSDGQQALFRVHQQPEIHLEGDPTCPFGKA